MPLAARRFFYLGPSGLDPVLDGGLVALDGSALNFRRVCRLISRTIDSGELPCFPVIHSS
jgi:hypothetical protein